MLKEILDNLFNSTYEIRNKFDLYKHLWITIKIIEQNTKIDYKDEVIEFVNKSV